MISYDGEIEYRLSAGDRSSSSAAESWNSDDVNLVVNMCSGRIRLP
jgi:hypothetical protein